MTTKPSPPPKQSTLLWRQHLLLISGYLLLAVLLTWPTVTHLPTHLPGDGGDDPAIAWNLWWLKYSLLNEPQNPFFSEAMFYPLGINLAFYTLTVLNGLNSLPLLLNFGVVAASNLHMWFSFALSGYSTFLLLRYWLSTLQLDPAVRQHSFAAAALGGLFVAAAANRLFYLSLGQFNIASTHWIALCWLFFLKMHHQPRNPRWVGLTALFLVFQAWTELTYASFLIIAMALAWVYWLLSDRRRSVLRLPFVAATAGLVSLFALGISPILAAMLPDLLAEGDFFVVDSGFADAFSADLAGFFVPTMLHPWFGNWVQQTGIANIDKGQHIYLGLVLMGLAAVGGLRYGRQRGVALWLVLVFSFAYLSLGPMVVFNGQPTGLPGIFGWLQQIPFINGNRYPSRFSVMLILSLAAPAALGVSWLLGRLIATRIIIHRVLLAGLAALFLIEHLAIPLPQSDMRVPPAYQVLAADPEPGAMLDIPFAWRNGFRITGAYTTGFMRGQFYQTVHQRPMVQGNTSRNPSFKFQYFTQAPVLDSLRILSTGYDLPPELAARDAVIAPAVLRFLNLRYIVVRPEPPGYLNDPAATLPYIQTVLPVTPLQQSDGLHLYRVELPPLPAEIDLLANPDLRRLYFAEGWGLDGPVMAAHRQSSRLLVPLNGEAQELTLTLRSYPGGSPNTVQLAMNGWRSTAQPFDEAGQTLRFEIPADAVQAGLNNIRLHFQQRDSLAILQPQPPEIGLVSAGEETGNLGQIFVNGENVSLQQRGYNLARISADGRLIARATFDTHANPTANAELAEFVAALNNGEWLAVVAKDEASLSLDTQAVAALQSLGSTVNLREQFRSGHALLLQKGGSFLAEASDRHHAVEISNGYGLREANVAALVEGIRFSAICSTATKVAQLQETANPPQLNAVCRRD